jgi:hypothetical protein
MNCARKLAIDQRHHHAFAHVKGMADLQLHRWITRFEDIVDRLSTRPI